MPHHIISQPQPESFTRLPDQSRFSELQALRAIAAAMVVFDHAVVTWYDKLAGTAAPATALHLSAFGVKLFFCISGFIIFNSVWNLWAGWPSVKNFAVRRLIRIVPLYWCITLIYAGKLSLQGSSPTIVQLFQSLPSDQ